MVSLKGLKEKVALSRGSEIFQE